MTQQNYPKQQKQQKKSKKKAEMEKPSISKFLQLSLF